MSVFNFLKEIAIDLGTANTLIYYNDQVIVDEPSVVAFDTVTNKLIAVGRQAEQMEGKTNDNIKTVRPLRDGVIADFSAAEHMLRGMIRLIYKGKNWFFPSLRMAICIPSGITEVEKRAVRDSAELAGAKEVHLVHESLAAAIGIGIDVEDSRGNMIIDIGGGTTEIAVIALSGIVTGQSVRIAGNTLDADIIHYMRRQYSMVIGPGTAERVKTEVGSVLADLDEAPADYAVQGRDMLTGIPRSVTVSYPEIAHCLDKSISKIEEAIIRTLEITPPELCKDIYETGIYLSGGGAKLRGLAKRISLKTSLPVHVADDPLRAVARGTCITLKNLKSYSFVME